jgi:transposase-like protein
VNERRTKRPALFRGRNFQNEIIVLCRRWYLRYAPILSQRIRCEMRGPNRSWRVDETYVRVAGRWTYLYRAVDSEGNTIDFMLSPNRDLTAAKQFMQLALWRTREVRPRVINVDGHPAYARAIAELKSSGELGRRCRCRPSPYLNNILEQTIFIKKRIAASLWFRSAEGALRTVAGYEAMHAMRMGQIRWLPKGDVVGQVQFIQRILGIAY